MDRVFRHGRALLSWFAWALVLCLAAGPTFANTTIIHAGHVITDAAAVMSGPTTITVVDGHITGIVEGHKPAPTGATVINLSDKIVLPGLIDAHVHLAVDPGTDFRNDAVDPDEWAVVVGARNARITALAGFTTVRDVGSASLVGFVLRRGTAEGLIPGPRILASGPSLSIIGGHGDVSGFRPEVDEVLHAHNTCTGAQQCAARVREAAKRGADVIKITATGGVLSQQARGLDQHFTPDEMRAIVTTAHGLGLKVAAHAHGPRGTEAAARAGVDSIEHGTFADEASLRAMKASGTALVPTLMAFTGLRERLGKGVYTPQVEAKVRATLDKVGKAAKSARKMGIPIVFGTDTGVFEHARTAEEFALYVSVVGMSNREALASATTAAARLLGLDDVGKITKGYSADMIAVASDPLQNIRALEKVDWVMVRGRVIR